MESMRTYRCTAPSARSIQIILAVGILLLAVGGWCSTAYASTQYRVVGRGWGHGIGMSQYGAQGFAAHGYTASQIIRYYYQGVSIGAIPTNATRVNVELVSGRSVIKLGVDGATAQLRNGTHAYDFVQNDQIELRADGPGMDLYRRRGATLTKLADNLTDVSTIASSATIATRFTGENGANGNHYRGALRIHRVGATLSVINRLDIELYLRGVVPSEVPGSWHPEALKAQAIAARSYAVATRSASGIYDVHSDTRSQMYLGIEHEEASTTAAVVATAGKAARYNGSVITAFFSSTSGGRTAAIEDVWGSPPRPYLKSVPDPYESSPYSRWPEVRAYSPAQLANVLHGYVSGSFRTARVTVNPSSRASGVVVTGSGGMQTMPAATFQVRLGLRSTWFRIERLTIVADAPAGGRVRVHGVIPTSGTTFLMRKTGSSWTIVRRLTPAKNGGFSRTELVSGSTKFGLRRQSALGPTDAV